MAGRGDRLLKQFCTGDPDLTKGTRRDHTGQLRLEEAGQLRLEEAGQLRLEEQDEGLEIPEFLHASRRETSALQASDRFGGQEST